MESIRDQSMVPCGLALRILYIYSSQNNNLLLRAEIGSIRDKTKNPLKLIYQKNKILETILFDNEDKFSNILSRVFALLIKS